MSIYKKLFEAKKEIGKITKDSKNPFFKSNYLSLNGLIDAIDSVLEKHELILLQPISDNKVTSSIVNIEDGETVQSCIELPNITDPQKLGSAITYYRRYTLQGLLGLQAEDDDANIASKASKPSNDLPWLNEKKGQNKTKEWINIEVAVDNGTITNINQIEKVYKISKETRSKLELLIK